MDYWKLLPVMNTLSSHLHLSTVLIMCLERLFIVTAKTAKCIHDLFIIFYSCVCIARKILTFKSQQMKNENQQQMDPVVWGKWLPFLINNIVLCSCALCTMHSEWILRSPLTLYIRTHSGFWHKELNFPFLSNFDPFVPMSLVVFSRINEKIEHIKQNEYDIKRDERERHREAKNENGTNKKRPLKMHTRNTQ